MILNAYSDNNHCVLMIGARVRTAYNSRYALRTHKDGGQHGGAVVPGHRSPGMCSVHGMCSASRTAGRMPVAAAGERCTVAARTVAVAAASRLSRLSCGWRAAIRAIAGTMWRGLARWIVPGS